MSYKCVYFTSFILLAKVMNKRESRRTRTGGCDSPGYIFKHSFKRKMLEDGGETKRPVKDELHIQKCPQLSRKPC